MAGKETIELLAQAVGIAAPIGQGFADRAAGEANAKILRTQGRYVTQAAADEETRARRDARQVISQQAANVLAEGGGDSSAMDVVRQNEVNLIADALAIRRRGEVQAAGFKQRADMAEYEGGLALADGFGAAGAKLLMTAAERKARERRLAVGVG